MALNFNNSPSNGTSENGFTYDSTQGVWNKDKLTTAQQTVVSDTAPTNPKGGDLWWNSTDLKLYIYYNDADSGQWASVRTEGGQGPTGRRSFTNIGSFTSGNYVGELAVANDTKAVYMWDGSAWKRFNVGADEFPSFTTQPPSTHAVNNNGTTSTITVAAEDPEGFPITYSYITTPSNPTQITGITNSGGTFTLTPSTNSAHAGNFVIKFLADDGVHKTQSTSTSVSLSNSYRYIKIVINSVQGGGNQAQVTEFSIADSSQTTSQVTAASFTSYSGSVSSNPNTHLNDNTTGSSSSHTNLTGLPFTLEIDLAQAYDVGTGIKYLQVGTSDDANRFPNSVTVYGANQSNYSDQEAIVTNASVPAYDGVRQMKLVDFNP